MSSPFNRASSVRIKSASFSGVTDPRRLIHQLNKDLDDDEKDYFRTEALFYFKLSSKDVRISFRQILSTLFLDKKNLKTCDVTAFIERTLIDQERNDLLRYVTEFKVMIGEDSDEAPPFRRSQRSRHTTGSRSTLPRLQGQVVLPKDGNESDDENTHDDDVIEGTSQNERPPSYALEETETEKGIKGSNPPTEQSADEKLTEDTDSGTGKEEEDAGDEARAKNEGEEDTEKEEKEKGEGAEQKDDDVTAFAEEEVVQERKKGKGFFGWMKKVSKSSKKK